MGLGCGRGKRVIMWMGGDEMKGVNLGEKGMIMGVKGKVGEIGGRYEGGYGKGGIV